MIGFRLINAPKIIVYQTDAADRETIPSAIAMSTVTTKSTIASVASRLLALTYSKPENYLPLRRGSFKVKRAKAAEGYLSNWQIRRACAAQSHGITFAALWFGQHWSFV